MKPRIMIVEDEGLVARDIKNSLITLGYDVCATTSSGEASIKLAEEHKPDLILMDVILKGELDGIQASEIIRKNLNIPVIYLTAYTDEETVRRAKISEAFGYLIKPFEERELKTTIEMALYKHQMETKLRASHEWLQTILSSIGDGVIATDVNLIIKFMNNSAEELIGLKAKDCINKKITDIVTLIAGKDVFQIDKVANELFTKGNFLKFKDEINLLSRSGAHIPVTVTFSLIKSADNSNHGMVVVLHDISDIKMSIIKQQALQDRLHRAQRMESLGILAGGIAKDLHNILEPLSKYSDIVIEQLPKDSKIKQDIEVIKNSFRKALAIINDLLTLGCIGKYSFLPISINNFYKQFVKKPTFETLLSTMPTVDFKEEIYENLPPILASEKHLNDMLLNLIMFAIEQTGQEGKIQIKIQTKEFNEATGSFEIIEPAKYIMLAIRYHAEPLNPAEIARLFEPFFITKHLNCSLTSGLALSIVYSIIKEHKGFIDITSNKEEKWNEIIIYLPVYEETKSQTISQSINGITKEEPCGNRETILIVDDDAEERQSISRYLHSLGYNTILAENGKTALEIIKNNIESGSIPIDLVLLDMILADNLDGLETYKKILEIAPKQKAILMSGFAIIEKVKEALKLGVKAYIQKPIDEKELAKTIYEVLNTN